MLVVDLRLAADYQVYITNNIVLLAIFDYFIEVLYRFDLLHGWLFQQNKSLDRLYLVLSE